MAFDLHYILKRWENVANYGKMSVCTQTVQVHGNNAQYRQFMASFGPFLISRDHYQPPRGAVVSAKRLRVEFLGLSPFSLIPRQMGLSRDSKLSLFCSTVVKRSWTIQLTILTNPIKLVSYYVGFLSGGLVLLVPFMHCVNHSSGLPPPNFPCSALCIMHQYILVIWSGIASINIDCAERLSFFFPFFFATSDLHLTKNNRCPAEVYMNLSSVCLHAVPTILQGWTKMSKCMYLDKYCHSICIHTLLDQMFPIGGFAFCWHITINAPQYKIAAATAALRLWILYIDRSHKDRGRANAAHSVSLLV